MAVDIVGIFICMCNFLCEDRFHRFYFVKRDEKQVFLQAVFFTICRLAVGELTCWC